MKEILKKFIKTDEFAIIVIFVITHLLTIFLTYACPILSPVWNFILTLTALRGLAAIFYNG